MLIAPPPLARWMALVGLFANFAIHVQAQWSLGVHGAGQYTLTTVEVVDPTGLTEVDVIDGIGHAEGLQLGYSFSDRWSVGLGVLHERRSYTVEASVDTSLDVLGLAIRGELFTSTRIARSYLQVPFAARWRPIDWLGVEGGVAASFLLASDAVSTGELDVALFGFGTEVPFTSSSTSTDGLRAVMVQAIGSLVFLVHPSVDITVGYLQGIGPLEEDDNAGSTTQRMLRLGVTYTLWRQASR